MPLAQQVSEDERVFEDLDGLVEAYNENVDEFPGPAKMVIANERFGVKVRTDEGHLAKYSFHTDSKARITEYHRGRLPAKPTMMVSTNEATIRDVRSADSPVSAAREAYRRDDISLRGIGLVNRIEVRIAESFLKRTGGSSSTASSADQSMMATAQATTDTSTQRSIAAQAVSRYNENVDELPDAAKTVLANERIGVKVTTNDGGMATYTFSVGPNAQITEYHRGFSDDSTIIISTDEATLRDIKSASSPISVAKAAYRSGDISVRGVGPTSSVKVELLRKLVESTTL